MVGFAFGSTHPTNTSLALASCRVGRAERNPPLGNPLPPSPQQSHRQALQRKLMLARLDTYRVEIRILR